MITGNSFFQPMDNDSKRRRALANIYEFLLKLAEEKKNSSEAMNSDPLKEKISAPLQENIPSYGSIIPAGEQRCQKTAVSG